MMREEDKGAPWRGRVVRAAFAMIACGWFVWVGWTLGAIHACEKHDACEDAPSVIQEGLAELQAKDPATWCPPSPATCKHAPAGWVRP